MQIEEGDGDNLNEKMGATLFDRKGWACDDVSQGKLKFGLEGRLVTFYHIILPQFT